MESKETYTLQELFDNLSITIIQLSRNTGINEVTLARIRDGRKCRRDTVNKLLRALSNEYGRTLNISNVSGINVMVNARREKAIARRQEEN